MALKRINMNLEEDLLQTLDDYAKSMHVNRSAAVSMLLSQVFYEKKAVATIGDLLEVYRAEQNAKAL